MENKELPSAKEYYDLYAVAKGFKNWHKLHQRYDHVPSLLYENTLKASEEYAQLVAEYHRIKQAEIINTLLDEHYSKGTYPTKVETLNAYKV